MSGGLNIVLTVDLLVGDGSDGSVVQAVRYHSVRVRGTGGDEEALDAAGGAEAVLGGVGVEGVGGEGVVSLQQLEAAGRYQEMFVLLFLADAAVAVYDGEGGRGEDLEPDGAAMAAAFVSRASSRRLALHVGGCGLPRPVGQEK